MIEIRIHGRGGQGAVTLAHILSMAATYEGKYGQSSQGLTVERRGAPIMGFARIGDKPISERGAMSKPDYVVVIDPLILGAVDVEAGLAKGGIIVANTVNTPKVKHKCVTVDATSIALEILKRSITNTVMLGAVVAATNIVTLESIKKGTRFILGKKLPEDAIEANLRAIQKAYDDVKSS